MDIREKYPSKFLTNDVSGCWEWQGPLGVWGHGMTRFEGKQSYTHRISWRLSKGDIPRGLMVLHKCNNACCANPDHLYLGNHDDNMRDMKVSGRRKNKTRGERQPHAKLREVDIPIIRERGAREMYKDIAADYGVSVNCIASVVTRANWAFVP